MAFQTLAAARHLRRPNLQTFPSLFHLTHLRFSTLLSYQPLYDSLQFKPDKDIHTELTDEFVRAIKKVSHIPTQEEAICALHNSGLNPTPQLVRSAIWAFVQHPNLALLAFRWGQKLGCCHQETWNLIIWLLGNHNKFNTAWSLIKELNHSSMGTRRALLIMIDRYAHGNDPGKAMWTFEIMNKFDLGCDQEAFYYTVNALCRHGFVEEAESFLHKHKKFFPVSTEGFNIILNAWCNIWFDVFEARRVLREMSKCCLKPDATSHALMLSCYAKDGNLFDSLRIYNEMKSRGWCIGIEAYNSLISVLTRENCHSEALKMMEVMKTKGFKPDSVTYNAVITPLCEAKKIDEAKDMLRAMMDDGIDPTIETFHAFLGNSRFEETFDLLDWMKDSGLGPTQETFRLILDNLFVSNQPRNAIKIWESKASYKIVPDSSLYTVMIQGLITCKFLIRAREVLAAMKLDGFLVDPKFVILLNKPESSDVDTKLASDAQKSTENCQWLDL